MANIQKYTLREAQLSDVPEMMLLLNDYARQAEILPRSEDEVYRSIREWMVIEANIEGIKRVVGMGALVIIWRDLAEIRSLVIEEAHQGNGLGKKIVNALLDQARILKLNRVFALTRKPGFFFKLDFHLTYIENLPRKVQRDCVSCPKFHACDESAMIIYMEEKEPAYSLSTKKNGTTKVMAEMV